VYVCTVCEGHQNKDSKDWQARRDRDHYDVWNARFEAKLARLAQEHQAKVESLEAEISGLTSELEQRPVRVVTENLDRETVREAESERDRAYRARETAFSALSEIHYYHKDRGSNCCSCGRQYSKCETIKILDSYQALNTWEARQFDLRRRGLPHSLPHNHPALHDSRWSPKE
jgi:hypothetical protein